VRGWYERIAGRVTPKFAVCSTIRHPGNVSALAAAVVDGARKEARRSGCSRYRAGPAGGVASNPRDGDLGGRNPYDQLSTLRPGMGGTASRWAAPPVFFFFRRPCGQLKEFLDTTCGRWANGQS